ncbi:MAG: VOC family protein [Patescibacteria group bacterium]|nr:VOC family protein [Patescibacteria group bacterium]
MKQIVPHIHFADKKCREAMEFYHSCLGGKLSLMTVGECPAEVKEGMKKMMPGITIDESKIMHADLKAKDGSVLVMGADMMDPKTFTKGDLSTVAIMNDDEKEARDIFAKLSKGGKVTMDLMPMFWGALFGSWTDKYGVDWMINCEMPKKSK